MGCEGDAFRTSGSQAVSTLSKGNHGSLVSVGWDISMRSNLIWKVSSRVKRELQSSTVCHSLEVTPCLHDQQELPGQGQDSLSDPSTNQPLLLKAPPVFGFSEFKCTKIPSSGTWACSFDKQLLLSLCLSMTLLPLTLDQDHLPPPEFSKMGFKQGILKL